MDVYVVLMMIEGVLTAPDVFAKREDATTHFLKKMVDIGFNLCECCMKLADHRQKYCKITDIVEGNWVNFWALDEENDIEILIEKTQVK